MVHPLVDYGRGVLAKVSQSGWRPFFGWGGGALNLIILHFAFIEVPRQALSVPEGFYVGVLGFTTLMVSTFIARGVEKQMDQRAPGALKDLWRPEGPAMGPGAARAHAAEA